jgi:hypothetical protein
VSFLTKWLHSLFGGGAHVLSDVLKLSERAIVALIHTLVSAFTPVKRAWHDMVAAAEIVRRLFVHGYHDLYLFGRWVVRTAIPRVVKWAERQFAKAAAELKRGLLDVEHYALKLVHAARLAVDALESFVVNKVLDPLTNDFKQAWGWITDKGETLWGYVDHPERLAKLLIGPLWRVLVSDLQGSQRLIAKWLVASMLSAMLQAADFIESVLADML